MRLMPDKFLLYLGKKNVIVNKSKSLKMNEFVNTLEFFSGSI